LLEMLASTEIYSTPFRAIEIIQRMTSRWNDDEGGGKWVASMGSKGINYV